MPLLPLVRTLNITEYVSLPYLVEIKHISKAAANAMHRARVYYLSIHVVLSVTAASVIRGLVLISLFGLFLDIYRVTYPRRQPLMTLPLDSPSTSMNAIFEQFDKVV